MINSFLAQLPRVLVIWTLGWGQATAIQLDFDLTDGAFFGTPGTDFHYFSNNILLPNSITVSPDNPAEIWLNFVSQDTGKKQHLEVFDEFPNTAEQIAVGLLGSQTLETQPFFSVELTGVSGDFIGNPLTTKDGDCDPGVGCFSFGLPPGGDLTESSFYFHDLHITMSVAEGTKPFEIDSLNFLVNGDRFAVGTWPVPIPAALPLFLSGIAGLGTILRLQRRKV